MRFTIHVRLGHETGVSWYLVDCGLDTIQATNLALALEEHGYEYRIDISGSADELMGSPLVYLSQVARDLAIQASGLASVSRACSQPQARRYA